MLKGGCYCGGVKYEILGKLPMFVHCHFCKHCGNPLFSRADHRPGRVFIRAGSLDDNPQIRPQAHFWTAFKAPWHEICDGLPQHPEGLPAK